MEEIADNVFKLAGRPAHGLNSYLVGVALVDARTRHAARRILSEVNRCPLRAHVLTHAHADHQGSSAAICKARDVPLWCGTKEVATAESGRTAAAGANNVITRWQERNWAGPGHPVERALTEGDTVGEFEVLEVPGHAPGHIALWRERDRTLVAGDVLFNRHPLTGRAHLSEPPTFFTIDPETNRASIRRIAALRPRLACFGHGPVVRDPGLITELADRLPPPSPTS
jgi:glyoxylase-like metal-dependent hydrolase (beta-lactamase superfamily II)